MFRKVGIIGLGLIGGSLAKALKYRSDLKEIVAFNRHEDVLSLAKNDGVITDYSTEIDEHFRGCDLVFICTPVDQIYHYAKKISYYIEKDCIVTDVGSTKANLAEKMDTLSDLFYYIGAHPMTGAEKFRYGASKEHLFENAYYILAPSPKVPKEKIQEFELLISSIGAIPILVSPSEHDYITAAISHVPHILAAGLVNTVKKLDTPKKHMHLLAAGGFKDITRIASSNPEMWKSICFENKSEILHVLTTLEKTIAEMKKNLMDEKQNEVYDYFDQARLYRDSFHNVTPGPYTARYEITVDVLDKPGSIAIITVLFSSNNINIKNIEILNNRERDNGVLLISFQTQAEQEKSILLLRQMNYEVYCKN